MTNVLARSFGAFADNQLKRVSTIFLLITVLAAYSIPGAAVSQTNQPSTGQGANERTREERGRDNQPITVKVLPTEKTEAERQQDEKDRAEKVLMEGIKLQLDAFMVEYTKLAAWIAAGLLGVAVAQAGLFWWQLRMTRATTQSQLRAYLFSDYASVGDTNNLKVGKRRKPSGFVMGGIRFKNTGHTPAHNVLHWSAIRVCEPSRENELTVPKMLSPISRSVIAPGNMTVRSMTWPHRLTAKDINDIVSGKLAIYLFGRTDYEDVFGNKHFTEMRVRYTGAYPPPVDASMTFCDEGNDAS